MVRENYLVDTENLRPSSLTRFNRFLEKLKLSEENAITMVPLDCFSHYKEGHPECKGCEVIEKCKTATTEKH